MHQLLGTINPFEFNQEHNTERRVSHLHSPGDEIDLPAAGHNTLSHYQGGLPQEPFDKNVDAYLQGPTAPAWNPAIAAQLSPNTLGNTSQRRQLSQPFSTPQRLQVPLASDEGYYTHVRSQQDTRSERSDQSNSVTYVMRRLQATPRTIPDQQRARAISQEQASDYSMESLQSPSREGTKSDDAGSNVGTIQCPFEDCKTKSKTQSDHKKHLARHKLEHICKEEDCARKNKGFATINDLNRHKSTVHKQRVEGARIYRCFAPGCNKPEKDWPRKDNFRSHLKKAHPNEDTEELTKTSEEWWARQQFGSTNPERQQVFGSTAPPVRQHRQQVARPVTPFYQLPVSDPDQAQTPSLPEAPYSQFPYVPQGAYSPFSGPTRNHQLSNRQFMTLQGYRDVSSENVNTSSGGQSSFFNSSSVTFPEQQQHSNQHRLGGAGSKRTYAQTEHHGEHLQQRNFSTNVTSRPISSHMSRTSSFQEQASQIRTTNQRPQTVAHFPSLQEERQDSMEGFSAFQQLEDLHQTEYHGDIGLSGVGYGVDGMFSGFAHNAVPDDVMPDDGVPGISVTQYEHPQTDLPSEDNTGIVDVDGLNKFLEPYRSRTEDDPEKRHVKRVLENALLSLGTAASDVKPLTDDYITESRNAAGKPVFKCTFPKCNSSKKSEGWKLKSEIKKHMKRHSKPYGCTYDKCYRQFGSKSDWIRHERKRHSLQDSWRCVLHPSQTALGDQPCLKVFPSRQQFVDHLRGDHNLTKENNPDEFNSQVTKQHLNTDFQPQYWCGFCQAILRLVKKGKEGIHERYDHIAQHITGEGWHMDDWMPAYGRLNRGELRKQYPLRLTQSPIDEEEEDVSPSNSTSEKSNSPIDEQSPPLGPTLPRSQHATPQHQQRVQQQQPQPRASHALGSAPRTHAGQKRTASTAGLDPPTQHIQRRANYWRCHACQHYNLIAISPACNSGNCSHEPCRMCTYTYRRSMDEM
jgi:hypothetical protein